VTELLGSMQVMHLTRVTQDEGMLPLEPVDINDELAGCRSMRDLAVEIAARLGVSLELESPGLSSQDGAEERMELDLGKIETILNGIHSENAVLLKDEKRLHAEMQKTKEVMDELQPYVDMEIPVEQFDKFSFLHFAVGSVAEPSLPGLTAELGESALVIPLGASVQDNKPRRMIAAVSDKRGRWALDTVLSHTDFKPAEFSETFRGLPAQVLERTRKKYGEIEKDEEDLEKRMEVAGGKYGDVLKLCYARLVVREQILIAKSNFGRTSSTVVISGWLPGERVDEVSRAIIEETGHRTIIEVYDGEEMARKGENVPYLMKDPKWLAPFQRLVSGYGVPRYSEIEPTLFAAISFVIMFGLMFGDLGHGLLLALGGVLIMRRSKAKSTKDMGFIILVAGAAAALFGVFFQGAVFGLSLAEMGFPLTIGLEPLGRGGANVTPYLTITIIAGICIITVGIILNIINRLRRGDFEEGFGHRFGVAGFIFYWGALGLGIKWLVSGSSRYDNWILAFVIVVPMCMIIFREPIFALLARRKKLWRDGPGIGIVSGLIECYETVASYLANTMSFARVGAFALSHAGLCLTIYEFERVARDIPGEPLWSIVVLVVGHLFVVALEGFIVFIQIIRLEYYEFFGKFFSAEGKAFEPFEVNGTVPHKGGHKL